MKKILIGSLLLLSVFLFSEDSRPYRLINADVGTATKVNDATVMKLVGNVHFFYGETEFFSNTAELYDTEKITILSGNVKVFEDSLSLFADKVKYFRLTEKLLLEGNVLAREDHADSTYRTFTADSISYYRAEKEFEAYENVKVFDEREKIYGNCGFLKYEMNNGYGYLLKRPVLSFKDSLEISAEKIEYFEEFSKIIANFDVITKSDDFTIYSDFFLFFEKEEKAIFLGKPKFISDYAEADAKEIRLYFLENKFNKAELQEECFVKFSTKQNDVKKNWISSTLMQLDFEDGKIKVCDAEGDVKSYFHQEKAKNVDFMINDVSGQNMKFLFENNEVEEIIILDKIDGIYKFNQ